MPKRLTTVEFTQKARAIHGDLYDYSESKYTSTHTKLLIKCKVHGEFWQKPNDHINCKARCPTCFGKFKNTINSFVKKSRASHGQRYDYSMITEDTYVNNSTKVPIICREHGVFWQKPNNHYILGNGCPKCKQYSYSKGERKIELFLKKNNINYTCQHKFDDLKFHSYLFFDFFLPSHSILIEYNGEQHYKPNNLFHRPEKGLDYQIERDQMKAEYADKNGIQFLVIPYWEEKNINTILQERIIGYR